jgi:transglutaminase-like putative cysteine protease
VCSSDLLRRPVSIRGFSPALQQATELELQVVGPAPLPGFPDAVRFKGRSREGAMQAETELWVSPTAGELKEQGSLGGIEILTQRAELPAPAGLESGRPFFERTLAPLPPHPFLPWIPRATLRWEGPDDPQLPEDDQQKRLGPGRIQLTRAARPSAAEAVEPPVKGRPGAEEAPFLAPSPLVPFQDLAFDGLLARLRPVPGASRWELARQVNRFVFDWITEKDYTVGFATALEVAHTPRGDCTEHGVLAVALLRKLGVPSRGVLGWIGTGGVMGLHFWVEVGLKGRWVPDRKSVV